MDRPIDVAIIGGGPAGLAAAIRLKQRGIRRVVVFEREPEAGGIPRHCAHPPYGVREFARLMTGPEYARRLRTLAERLGVEIALRHSVTALLPHGMLALATPDGAQRPSARRVLLAMGARETPRSSRLVSGDRPVGVINTATLQDSVYLKRVRPFERPVVIGTELVALSALWTCRHAGMRPVAMIEAGPRPVARWPLGIFPHLLGVPLITDARLLEIIGTDRMEAVRLGLPSGERLLACDGVILSGGFLPEASLIRASDIILDPKTGGPVVDQYGRCSDTAYFAAGNLLRPIETAGWCHREGERAADAVADDLAGLLPAPDRSITVSGGSGIGWVMPQRLVLPATCDIQFRADAPVTGRLTVREGGRLRWSRRIATRQERRLRVPAAALHDIAGDIMIAIEP
jgi:NADPH-dependent 2,4-dienoyl-CoA reductase/sulfur reductase-like enzyme